MLLNMLLVLKNKVIYAKNSLLYSNVTSSFIYDVHIARDFFFGLGARLYYLQHLQEKKYKTLSNKNRLKVDIIPPKRGLISDSNGRIIADTKRIFRVEILKETILNLKKVLIF